MSLSVVALTPYPIEGASSRYRVYAFAGALAEHGIRLDIRPFLDGPAYVRMFDRGPMAVATKAFDVARGAARCWADLGRAGRYDVAFVHRQVWPLAGDAALARLRRHQTRWVYDFDDAMWVPHVSDANRGLQFIKPHGQFAALAAGATGVAAGNAELARWARAQRPGRAADDVAIVPTAVDTRTWVPGTPAPGPPRIVWIGSPSTVHYLDHVAPALQAVSARHPEVELHVMGAPFACSGVRVVTHRWSLDAEHALVATGTIGLSPLPDDEWTRGKCGHKLLLYLACGLPAVASPVGVHNEIVQHGENGFLCDSARAFADRIECLLTDAELRARLGRAGRATIERSYSVTAVAPRLAEVLERAAAGRR